MSTVSRGVALVAGATGALGRRIALRLVADSWTVHAGGRNKERLAELAAMGAIPAPVLERLKPDIIINAAGIGGGTFDRALLHDANVEVLRPLIALAQASPGCLLVQCSTPATQFRFADRMGIRESDPFTPPVSPYAASKQDGERLITGTRGLDWCILRIRAGYGHGAPSMVENLKAMIAARRPLPLVRGGQAVIDLVHSDDIADAVAAVAAHRSVMAGRIANIAGPEALSFRQIVETLAHGVAVRPKYVPVPALAVRSSASLLERAWSLAGASAEPPLTRHVAGALIHHQTLDLSVLKQNAGWFPTRRFADHALERRGQ
jgi:nucleoside-diphosphate-sugar epimerase